MAYKPRKQHTPEELRRDLILDLEADLEWSIQEGLQTEEWLEYRDQIRIDLENLRAGGPDSRLGPNG